MTSLCIIHMSDLHLSANKQANVNLMTAALCKKLKEFREKNEQASFKLLIVSGDLVDKGTNSYDRVAETLQKICKASGINDANENVNQEINNVFVVPGNHDADTSICTQSKYSKAIRKMKDDPSQFFLVNDQRPPDKDLIDALHLPFHNYTQFINTLTLMKGATASSTLPPGFAQAKLDIGIPIHLIGLNSAIITGPNDLIGNGTTPKNRYCGWPYLSSLLDENTESCLNVVVSHYPLSWICEEERNDLKNVLIQMNAILLTGHVHEGFAHAEGLQDAQMYYIGSGTAYGKRWGGTNSCCIIEILLDTNNPNPILLHDWIWIEDYGKWRAMEPINFPQSGTVQSLLSKKARTVSNSKKAGTVLNSKKAGTVLNSKKAGTVLNPKQNLLSPATQAGHPDIFGIRKEDKRESYVGEVLSKAKPGSELIVIGRCLKDWASIYGTIEQNIKNKGLKVKLGLIDENTLLKRTTDANDKKNRSWIEKPIISKDDPISHVHHSMEEFKKITLSGDCKESGSLEIYGLPFYVYHSFVAYTNDKNMLCCTEEVGAASRDKRPFIEVEDDPNSQTLTSWAKGIKKMYSDMLTPERLLLKVLPGNKRKKHDTTNRSKIIAPKVEELGLVDLAFGPKNLLWRTKGLRWRKQELNEFLNGRQEGNNQPERDYQPVEIFMVGRSNKHMHRILETIDQEGIDNPLIKAVRGKNLRCTLVMAASQESLISDDPAENHRRQWDKLISRLLERKKSLFPFPSTPETGFLEIFEIPVYLPTSFASYCYKEKNKIIRYCTLEPGIGLGSEEHPILCFQEVNKPKNPDIIGSMNPKDYADNDFYNRINKIYRQIVYNKNEKVRLLFSSKDSTPS